MTKTRQPGATASANTIGKTLQRGRKKELEPIEVSYITINNIQEQEFSLVLFFLLKVRNYYFLSKNLNLFFIIAYWPEVYTLYSSLIESFYLLNTVFNRSKEK